MALSLIYSISVFLISGNPDEKSLVLLWLDCALKLCLEPCQTLRLQLFWESSWGVGGWLPSWHLLVTFGCKSFWPLWKLSSWMCGWDNIISLLCSADLHNVFVLIHICLQGICFFCHYINTQANFWILCFAGSEPTTNLCLVVSKLHSVRKMQQLWFIFTQPWCLCK